MRFFKFIQSGILIAVIGIILFSAKAVLVKLAYEYEVSSIHLLFFRMLFSLPVYLMFIALYKPKQKESIESKDYVWLLFFGFIGYYLASYFDFLGLKYIRAGLERVVLFVYPTLVLILSRVFFKTKINKNQLLAIVVTYFGVVIAFWNDVQIPENHVYLGIFLIFLSALAYASYVVGSGWLIPKFGVVLFTSYAMVIATVCVIIHYLVVDRTTLLNYPAEVYFLGGLMAFVSTLIPSFLVSIAIKKLGSNNFSIIGSVGPISTIILAYIFLNETVSNLQIIGSLVVIFGVLFISKANKQKS